jgi:hypothetical protein
MPLSYATLGMCSGDLLLLGCLATKELMTDASVYRVHFRSWAAAHYDGRVSSFSVAMLIFDLISQ